VAEPEKRVREAGVIRSQAVLLAIRTDSDRGRGLMHGRLGAKSLPDRGEVG
jgi:hypothetical protein